MSMFNSLAVTASGIEVSDSATATISSQSRAEETSARTK